MTARKGPRRTPKPPKAANTTTHRVARKVPLADTIPPVDALLLGVEYNRRPFGGDLLITMRGLLLRDFIDEHRAYKLAWARLTWQLQEWGYDPSKMLASLPTPEISERDELEE